MLYSVDALGTCIEITLKNAKNDSGISESFSLIQEFESQYSRFVVGNRLWEINAKKSALLDPEISSLLRLCLRVSALTEGAFDITLLPLLENRGYGISQEKLPENISYKNIILKGNELTLEGGVQIEFGSCGKGYMLDCIAGLLSKYHTDFTLNFWGDIRVVWEQKVLLEDPLESKKSIGEIVLQNKSLASSAGNRRKFWKHHHLMNMQDTTSQNDKLGVYVTHRLGVMADIFATALFVTPLKKTLEILKQIDGLEALIIWADGKIFISQGFDAELTI